MSGYYKQFTKFLPLLNKSQELKLGEKCQQGDQKAREEMILKNLLLPLSIARNYAGSGVDLRDLVQEGIIGLIKAVEKYDPQRGFRFSTYAYWQIEQAVRIYSAERSGVIKVPKKAQDTSKKIRRFEEDYSKHMNRYPTIDEIMRGLHLTRSIVENHRNRTMPKIYSLDQALTPESSTTFANSTRDNQASVEEEVIIEKDRQKLQAAINNTINKLEAKGLLSGRDKEIIKYLYGLGITDAHSLRETSARFGISIERVRQVKNQALIRLRRFAPSYSLKDFHDI